jgi:acyl-CoA thioesterase-1
MPLRIAFIGDSFVAGTGDPAHLDWVGRACAAATARGHDVTGYNLGIRRDTGAEVRTRWAREAMARLPDARPRLLVFSFGVNDAIVEDGRRRVPLADTAANARAILTEARGFPPLPFVGPPPTAEEALNTRVAELESRLAATCADLAVPFLHVLAPLLTASPWRGEAAAGDGAHPAAAGYAALAALVEAWPAWRAHLP